MALAYWEEPALVFDRVARANDLTMAIDTVSVGMDDAEGKGKEHR